MGSTLCVSRPPVTPCETGKATKGKIGVGFATDCGTGGALFFSASPGSGAARSASATVIGGASPLAGTVAGAEELLGEGGAEPRVVTIEREARCTRSFATESLLFGASVRLIVLAFLASLAAFVVSDFAASGGTLAAMTAGSDWAEAV